MKWDAESYDRDFGFVTEYGHDLLDLIDVPAPARAIDIGCGTGAHAGILAERGYEVLGVDIDAAMLARAAQEHPTVEFLVADVMRLDLDGGMGADEGVEIQILAGGEGLDAIFKEVIEVIAAIETQQNQRVRAKRGGQTTQPLGLLEGSVHKTSGQKSKTYNRGQLYSVQEGLNSIYATMRCRDATAAGRSATRPSPR